MVDISAAGNVTVTIRLSDGFPVTFAPEDFSDSGVPVRFGREEVTNARIDMNGIMFSETIRRPLVVELHPLPNSETDRQLTMALLARWEYGEEVSVIDSMTIEWSLGSRSQPSQNWGNSNEKKSRVTFTDGIIASGSFGEDASAEGRFNSNPFVFKFAQIEGHYDASENITRRIGKNSQSSKQQQPKTNPKKVGAVYYFGSTANQFSQMAR